MVLLLTLLGALAACRPLQPSAGSPLNHMVTEVRSVRREGAECPAGNIRFPLT